VLAAGEADGALGCPSIGAEKKRGAGRLWTKATKGACVGGEGEGGRRRLRETHAHHVELDSIRLVRRSTHTKIAGRAGR